MKKIDSLTKCQIGNKVLQLLNREDIDAGEVVTIVVKTKKTTGEISSVEIKKGA